VAAAIPWASRALGLNLETAIRDLQNGLTRFFHCDMLEGMKKSPKLKKLAVLIRVSHDLGEYIRERAAREKRSNSNLVELIVDEARQAEQSQPAAS
jgi:hypothetical protein